MNKQNKIGKTLVNQEKDNSNDDDDEKSQAEPPVNEFGGTAPIAPHTEPLPQTPEQLTQEEQDDWNSCRDAIEETGKSGKAFSAPTYDHCKEEANDEGAYLHGFVDGCKKQKNANDEFCQLETDRPSVWGAIHQLNSL